MSEYRFDPLNARWVIVARDRAARPCEFGIAPVRQSLHRCPFCSGNEADTPEPVAVYSADGMNRATSTANEPWQVRVVPNMYPAVGMIDGKPPAGASILKAGFASFEAKSGQGVHEVIIESPRHVVSFTELSAREAELTLFAYRDRLRAFAGHPSIAYAQIFRNCGAAAGASVEHVHSQLIALSFVPPGVRIQLDAARAWHARHNECLLCRLMADESQDHSRWVCDSEDFVAYCPFAGRFPFETVVAPRRHGARFEEVEAGELRQLSRFLGEIIGRIERVGGIAAYNVILHTAPFDTPCQDHYHWHLTIFPRITTPAGFEWGTEMFINPVPPEDAAARLRG